MKKLPAGIERKDSADALLDQRLRVIARIERMGKPSVATRFAYCLGGGLELPLGCYFCLAAEDGAQIGLPDFDIGTVPAWDGSARLTKCIGSDAALNMILREKKISGPEALRLGLVQEVWPLLEIKHRAIALTEEIAALPAMAVRSVLEVIVGSESRSLETMITDERAAVLKLQDSADFQEGIMAFL